MKLDYLPLCLASEDEEFPYEEDGLHSHIIGAKIADKAPEVFSSMLRRATWLGILLTLLTSAVLVLCLNTLVEHVSVAFFPLWLQGLNVMLERYLFWLLGQSRWIQYIDGCLLGSGLILLLLTWNLQRGNEGQRWLAFFQIVGGIGNGILLLIPLVMYLPNLLLWLLALIVSIAALILIICFLKAALFK